MRIWERARCGAKGGLGEDWVRAGSHPSHFPACHPQLLSGLSKLQNFLLSWDLCLLGAWALPSPPEGSTEAQRAEIMNQPAGVQHMEHRFIWEAERAGSFHVGTRASSLASLPQTQRPPLASWVWDAPGRAGPEAVERGSLVPGVILFR